MQNSTPVSPVDAFDWSRLPADPGSSFRLHVRPHPETGEIIRGWNKQTNGIIYSSAEGKLYTYHNPPRTNEGVEKAQAFIRLVNREGPFTLIPRPVRRRMWREERKRYAKIVKARKAAEE